jgi:hypothetical protein
MFNVMIYALLVPQHRLDHAGRAGDGPGLWQGVSVWVRFSEAGCHAHTSTSSMLVRTSRFLLKSLFTQSREHQINEQNKPFGMALGQPRYLAVVY